jgi:hypothetical protein
MFMGRMWVELTVQAKRSRRTFGALVDSGSSVTILSAAYADLLGIKTRSEDTLSIGGSTRRVCYRTVDLHIPGTDCFAENMRVAVIARGSEDIPGAFIGADFLQRTGAFLDFRKGRHAIGADVDGRDPAPPDDVVRAKRIRLRRNGRR